MNRASTGVLVAAVIALVAPAETLARGWPRPAAGKSQSGDPEVIFTFDDGPHEKWSATILDTLERHRIRAIFYWVGHRVEPRRRYYKKRRALVDRAIRSGHLIGNHTVNHVHLCRATSDAVMEIDHNDFLYEALAELPIMLFRTPYGDRCKKLVALLRERDLDHLHWDIDPREYNGLTAQGTAAYVIGHLKKLRGRAVVLMHDTKGASAQALPVILDWIAAENARRRRSGRRQIRILSGSDLVIERSRGPLWQWGEDTAEAAAERFGRAMVSLLPGAPAVEVPEPPAVSSAEPPASNEPSAPAKVPRTATLASP